MSDDAGASHGCEQLGQCCAAMVADDEVACLAVLQEHDEPFCEESVSRFCWNVTICNAEGCTGLGLIP